MKGFLVIALIGLTTASATYLYANPDCRGLNDGVSIPNPEDCGKFFVCKDQVPVAKNCKSGLYFSPKLLYCLPPAEAHCDDSGTTPSTPTTPGTSPGPSPPGSGVDPGWCKHQPLGRKILYPNQCRKFITCIGNGVLKECEPGLHFDEKTQVCDWPQRVKCQFW